MACEALPLTKIPGCKTARTENHAFETFHILNCNIEYRRLKQHSNSYEPGFMK